MKDAKTTPTSARYTKRDSELTCAVLEPAACGSSSRVSGTCQLESVLVDENSRPSVTTCSVASCSQENCRSTCSQRLPNSLGSSVPLGSDLLSSMGNQPGQRLPQFAPAPEHRDAATFRARAENKWRAFVTRMFLVLETSRMLYRKVFSWTGDHIWKPLLKLRDAAFIKGDM